MSGPPLLVRVLLAWTGAILAAALAPALLALAWFGPGRTGLNVATSAFLVSLLHALLLGLPAALICLVGHRTGLLPASLAGALIGALPVSVYLLSTWTWTWDGSPAVVSFDGVLARLAVGATFGGLGAVAGAAFRGVLGWSGALAPRGAEPSARRAAAARDLAP